MLEDSRITICIITQRINIRRFRWTEKVCEIKMMMYIISFLRRFSWEATFYLFYNIIKLMWVFWCNNYVYAFHLIYTCYVKKIEILTKNEMIRLWTVAPIIILCRFKSSNEHIYNVMYLFKFSFFWWKKYCIGKFVW